MSCSLMSPKAINAIAEIIKSHNYDLRETPLVDIRVKLAEANVDSVLHRYSPAGREYYAKTCPFGEDAYWALVAGKGSIKPDEMPGLLAGQTAKEWAMACRFEQEHGFKGDSNEWDRRKTAKAIRLLCSYEYESCEIPNWSQSRLCVWLLRANTGLASRMSRLELPDGYDIDEDKAGEQSRENGFYRDNYAELRLAV